jgi:WD40 repeat protein
LFIKCIVFATAVFFVADRWEQTTAPKATNKFGTHPGTIMTLCLSPDGRWLACGGFDSPVAIWDMAQLSIDRYLEGGPDQNLSLAYNLSLAFASDGSTVVVGSLDGRVSAWYCSYWIVKQTARADARCIRSLAFAADGKHLAIGGSDGSVCLWDPVTLKETRVMEGFTRWAKYLAFSPDGARLAGASVDEKVRVWSLDVPGSVLEIEPDLPEKEKIATSLAFSPDGRLLALSRLTVGITLYDPQSGQTRATLTETVSPVLSIAFSTDGRTLAAGTTGGGIELWDVASLQRRSILRGHSRAVCALAFSPDGRFLLSGGNDSELRRWELVP